MVDIYILVMDCAHTTATPQGWHWSEYGGQRYIETNGTLKGCLWHVPALITKNSVSLLMAVLHSRNYTEMETVFNM